MRIRLTELNPEPEWHLIAFREIAAEKLGDSIVHNLQNTIGYSLCSVPGLRIVKELFKRGSRDRKQKCAGNL